MTHFLEVIDPGEAHRRLRAAFLDSDTESFGVDAMEWVPLDAAHGRTLDEDIVSPIDVPGFDRSNVDGYAVRAADTYGAEEDRPRTLRINAEHVLPGRPPSEEVEAGTATYVATGGVLPRGADAMVMVEHVRAHEGELEVASAVTPGARVAFAGSDMARGETVLRRGARLTARETGTIAALGQPQVPVVRAPRVMVFSTGDEVVAPGEPLPPGHVYDSNRRILVDTLRELGAEPIDRGAVVDDAEALRSLLEEALSSDSGQREVDAIVFSGGTSKGEGDRSVAIVREFAEVLFHGVAVKPGKPLAVARAENGALIAVLPGFPTSAVFTFHEFIAPIVTAWGGATWGGVAGGVAGGASQPASALTARMPFRFDSERGRNEFLLVGLLASPDGRDEWSAYPLGKGSGSITAFARADGFVTIPSQQEFVEANERVQVTRMGGELRPADLVVVGSHCVGLDRLLSRLAPDGWSAKAIHVGSQGALVAASRGESDLGGVHLANEAGEYNRPFISDDVVLVRGYRRRQGIVSREAGIDVRTARMVNRNRGSGTRVLIDRLLDGARPPGVEFEAVSHSAVAVAVAQKRADWGMAIERVATEHGLVFEPIQEEEYDFVIPRSRIDRPAVRAFCEALGSAAFAAELAELGFTPSPDIGSVETGAAHE